MKDDKEHIDQLFESLNDREFDIPQTFLDDLNNRLDNEPKKKRYFFLWFLAPLALIAAIVIGYFQYSYKSEVRPAVYQVNKLIAKDEYKEDSKTQNEIPLEEQDQNRQYPADSISSISVTKELLATKQTPLEKKSFKTIKKENNPKKSSNQVSLSQKTSKTKNESSKKLSKRIKTANKKSQTGIRVDKQTKRRKPERDGTTQKPVDIKTSKSKKEGDNLPNTGNEENNPDKIKPSSSLAANASPTVKEDKEGLSKDSVPETKKDSTLTQNTVDTTQQVSSGQVEKDKTKPKSPTGNWKKEIVLFAGLGGNSIRDTPKNSESLAKIKENQRSILAPSFGVNANLSYKKFTFGSGINYMQTGEKFHVDITSTVAKDSTYSEFIQDTVWVQDTSGAWIPTLHDTTIYHTVQYLDSASISRSFQNRYSWISIPIHFGYRFELGNYELIPRIGAIFNFGIAQGKGSYPNASFNGINRYQPAKFTISYLIQLEARRNFDKWFVFINPYFQSMISSSVSGDVIRRRYTSWGMQFGVGFNF